MIEYRVLTPRMIVTIQSESNSIADITKAIKACGIRPATVQAIQAVED